MPKIIDITLLLQRAFNILKTELAKPEYLDIEPKATQFLQQLRLDIRNGNGSSNISVFDHYWTAITANTVSAEGLAKMNKQNFTFFLKDTSTQEKLLQLLSLREHEQLDYRLINKIVDIGMIEHLDKFTFLSGNKPLFYVHRLEIMIFPELFTSISDRKKLNDTAKELGIRSENLTFEKLQYQIREKVDTFIHEEGLDNESDFVKRGIAWWVIDAAHELRKSL
jgi:hypothetical protein